MFSSLASEHPVPILLLAFWRLDSNEPSPLIYRTASDFPVFFFISRSPCLSFPTCKLEGRDDKSLEGPHRNTQHKRETSINPGYPLTGSMDPKIIVIFPFQPANDAVLKANVSKSGAVPVTTGTNPAAMVSTLLWNNIPWQGLTKALFCYVEQLPQFSARLPALLSCIIWVRLGFWLRLPRGWEQIPITHPLHFQTGIFLLLPTHPVNTHGATLGSSFQMLLHWDTSQKARPKKEKRESTVSAQSQKFRAGRDLEG